MFHLVSNKWFRINQYIPELGLDYKNMVRLWRVSECEELVGVIYREGSSRVSQNTMLEWTYCMFSHYARASQKMCQFCANSLQIQAIFGENPQ